MNKNTIKIKELSVYTRLYQKRHYKEITLYNIYRERKGFVFIMDICGRSFHMPSDTLVCKYLDGYTIYE